MNTPRWSHHSWEAVRSSSSPHSKGAIWAVFVVLAIFGTAGCGDGPADIRTVRLGPAYIPTLGAVEVGLTPSSLRFGNVQIGNGGTILTVTVRNTASVTRQINKIAIAGAHNDNFTQTSNCAGSMPAGGNCTVAVTFRPSQPGAQSAKLEISLNAAASPQTLDLSGAGIGGTQAVPAVGFDRGNLAFGNVPWGTNSSSLLSVGVTNTGRATLQIGQISLNGARDANFTETNNCGGSLAPESSCTVSVTFKPTAIGLQYANLEVTDNASDSPQQLEITGTGQSAASLDTYGGLETVSCTNPNAPNGWAFAQVGNRWWICDPLSHGFMLMGVDIASTNKTGKTPFQSTSVSKYGNALGTRDYDDIQLHRFQSWAFNGTGIQTDPNASPSISSHQLPQFTSPAGGGSPLYAEVNLNDYANQPVKDIVYGQNTYWTAAYGGSYHGDNLIDYFDPNYRTYIGAYLASLASSVSTPWVIGFSLEDYDYVFGSGAGPDFTSIPAGHNHVNVAYTVMTTSPVQTLNVGNIEPTTYRNAGVLYPDTKVYVKTASSSTPSSCAILTPCTLRDYLYKKYNGSISSLNSTWASNYTTFDSSGVVVTGEPLGTGNGSMQTFTHVLTAPKPSWRSIQILVNGIPVAGDCPVGSDYCSGTPGTGVIESPQASGNTWVASSQLSKALLVLDSLGSGSGSGYIQQITGDVNGGSNGALCVTGSGHPIWNTTVGGTTSDSQCTWTNIGPGVLNTSSIIYSSGALTVNFAVAPAPGATITVNYISCGWGCGTGLMDEDGRNTAWIGTNAICLIPSVSPYTPCTRGHTANASAGAGRDLDAWVSQFAGELLGIQKTEFALNVNTYTPFCGLEELGTGGVPPHAGWLQASDALLPCITTQAYTQSNTVGGSVPVTAAEGETIKAFIESNFSRAIINVSGNNESYNDSFLHGYTQGISSIGLTNQESRGQMYYSNWEHQMTTADSGGVYHWVGMMWYPSFDYFSQAEVDNIGLVDSLDNPYDGVHDCIASSTETINAVNYTDGGEYDFAGSCDAGLSHCILPGWQANTAYERPVAYTNAIGTSNPGFDEIMVNIAGVLYLFQPSNGISGTAEPEFSHCLTVGSVCSDDGTVAWTNVGTKYSATCWGNMLGKVAEANSLWLTLSQ